MADIAILVAEEYERRMKNPRQEGKQELLHLGSEVSISATTTANRMKQMLELKWGFDPKSQIAGAASTGFFSA